MRARNLVVALLALAALVVAGCGGSSDDTGGGSGEGSADSSGSKTTLNLVAYSTPEVVYDEIEPLFQKTGPG